MQDTPASGRATLIRYRDPKGAIDWLCTAFQFEKRCIRLRSDGSFAYAHLEMSGQQLTVTARDESSLEPAEPSAENAGVRCLAIPDIAGHFARAKAGGAEIVSGLSAGAYSCRDVEGHLWSFRASNAPMRARFSARLPRMEKRAAVAAAVALTLVALAVPVWRLANREAGAPSLDVREGQMLEQARFALAEEQAARRMAELSRQEALAALERERLARLEAERDAHHFAAELDEAHAAKTAEESSAPNLDEQATAWETQIARTIETPAVPIPEPGVAPAQIVPVSVTETPTPVSQTSLRSSNPQLAEAQAALAKGDVAEARRQFRRLAAEGVAEAALALGSTYDPVNASQTGIAPDEIDAAQAKHWYRRAIEITHEHELSERRAAP
jgi:uncharacterized glyoxalase superfamily protein PhnB